MAPDVEHLLPGVRRGDPAAFEALVRAMTPALYGYAAGMLRDPDAAEEIAQRTLIRVHRKRRRLDEGGTLRGFCYRIATNYALNHMRDGGLRRKREQEAAEMRKPEVTDPRSAALANEAWRLAEELPEVQRATLHLRYAQGLTIVETARALGVPEGTASTHQRKGLEALRKRLALTLAIAAPAVGLGESMSAHQPAGTVASASTVSRIGAAVMASTATQAVSNTTILLILALLLAAGGVTVAVVTSPKEVPDVQIATEPPIPEEATVAPTPDPKPESDIQSPPPTATDTSEPSPEAVAEPELTQDIELLRKMRERYEARDKAGFDKAKQACKDAQPWDLEVLLEYMGELLNSNVKRWFGYHPAPRPTLPVADDPKYWLESTVVGLILDHLNQPRAARSLSSKVVEWTLKTTSSYRLPTLGKRNISAKDHIVPRNYPADALGILAARLIAFCGYDARTEWFVKRVFKRTELEEAHRYARIQIEICRSFGDAENEDATSALESLYANSRYRLVIVAAFKALVAIHGQGYVDREANRLIVAITEDNEAAEWIQQRLIALMSEGPEESLALDAAERVFNAMEEADVDPQYILRGYSMPFAAKFGNQLWGSQKLPRIILNRFDRTTSIGLASSLLLAIHAAYAESNDPYVKRILLDKAASFKERGWTTRDHGFVLRDIFDAYTEICGVPEECLRVLTDGWYRTHRDWGLQFVDNSLFRLGNWLAIRTTVWGDTHARLLDVIFQRIEGAGEFGFGEPARRLDVAKEALVALDRPEVRAALVDKVAEVEDEEVRTFYEETLAEWDKQNGQ